MKIKMLCIFLVALLSMAQYAAAEGYAVIVHPSNSADFNAGILERIFLSKEKTFTTGGIVIPLNAAPTANIRKAFSEEIIKKSDNQIRSYWAMVMFSGKGTQPKELQSEQEMLDLVANNPNTIGYVSSSNVTDKVKVVYSF